MEETISGHDPKETPPAKEVIYRSGNRGWDDILGKIKCGYHEESPKIDLGSNIKKLNHHRSNGLSNK